MGPYQRLYDMHHAYAEGQAAGEERTPLEKAAPKMLEALKDILPFAEKAAEHLRGRHGAKAAREAIEADVAKARAAIAEAEGEGQ